MKFLGLILLNIASAAAGFSLAGKLRRKCVISREIIEMCSLMSVELAFTASDSRIIVNRLSKEASLSHLSFLNSFDFENIDIKTELDTADNERLNLLFKNLGKTDTQSMLDLISSFKSAMLQSAEKYDEYYKSHARLCIAFGVFGGLILSLVII